MLSYHYLFDIALILLSTKFLGLLTRKYRMPQVVGALFAGLVLGPAMLNILHETDFIQQVAELGVIVLMFTAGLETNIHELKKAGKASLIIAVCGVLVPLAGGFFVAYFFNKPSLAGANANILLQNIFIGVILTATSVSITVETLKELGKLSTSAGNAILGAALIDDILGIIALTLISSVSGESVSIAAVLFKIVLFFIFIIAIGLIVYYLFTNWVKRYDKDLRRFVIIAYVFCLLLAYASEKYFGVADITGAFFAGLILSNTKASKYIASRFETSSYMLLSPVFFASIGIKVVLPEMSASIVLFSILILLVAILTKIVGCGLGAKISGYTNKECMQVGVGMISRGEVALIVATKGASLGLMNAVFFGPMVIMVIITTIITPILLKIVFQRKDNLVSKHAESNLVSDYEKANNFAEIEESSYRESK